MQDPPISVLVIDDNADMLAMLAIVLRGRGYKVTAKEKFEGLEKEVTKIAPQLILIDKSLGWGDGCEVCRQLRRFPQFAGTIIIIFSAYEISAKEVEEAGADGYFEKPFGMQEFVDKIESHLELS